MTTKNFNRITLTEMNGSIYTDTLLVDFNNGSLLMFASMVLSKVDTKLLERAINKSNSIYIESLRRYATTAGQKYTIIKKSMSNSDYNHVIVYRKDKTEQLNDDKNELYDFCFYTKEDIDETEAKRKLYDKLYELTPVPLLEDWMPLLFARLQHLKYLKELRTITIHNPARIKGYRLVVSKDQLKNIVTGMLSSGMININNTSEKSEVIDMVEGLDSYLNIFGDILAERIQNSFVPKYDPSSNNYSTYVNNYDDSCYHNGIELYKAQKATIQASVENFKTNNVTFVIGEMGCGKTALGSGITYATNKSMTGMTNVVMCPSHLVGKWKKEIETLVPNAKAYIVKEIEDLIALSTKIKSKAKLEHTYVIISKENAKLSYEMRPCAIWSSSKKTFVCPHCGKPLTKKVKYGTGRDAEYVIENFEMTDFLKEKAYNSICRNEITVFNKKTGKYETKECGTRLWTPLNKEERLPQWIKLGASGWIMFRHVNKLYDKLSNRRNLKKDEGALFQRLVDLKNTIDAGETIKGIKAPRKYSLAKYIKEKLKGHIDYFICDELHLFKGDSKQGQAMADINFASKNFIGLTGTLLNGYADGLFYILYRTLPNMMKRAGYEYQDEARFMRDYGVIRKESKYSYRRGRTGDKISSSEKRLPGVSPIVFTKFLLENAVFISLSDMDGGLPEYKEIPVAVEMDNDLKEAYKELEKELKGHVGGYQEGAMKLMGSMVQALSVYPDMPYDQPPILHPDTNEPVIEPPVLEKKLRNKELELLRLVKEKKERGEKVLVYYEWTNKTDVAEKVTQMFKDNDIKSATLTSSVKAETREEWIEKQLAKDIDVLICNPRLVETGLDLLSFTTIVFYQVGYNIFTMRQASRRSWRLSQKNDIEVYFLYYKGTIQDQALSLMATKLQASMAIEGKFSEEGLRAMSNNEDLLTQIANSVVEGIKDTVQVQSFVTSERKEREHDNSRERVSMQSLLVYRPTPIELSYCKPVPNIKQGKIKSHKTTLRQLIRSELNVGNLF